MQITSQNDSHNYLSRYEIAVLYNFMEGLGAAVTSSRLLRPGFFLACQIKFSFDSLHDVGPAAQK